MPEKTKAETYIKLRTLTTNQDEPFDQILQRVVRELRGLAETAKVLIRVIGADEPRAKRTYSLLLTPQGPKLDAAVSVKPALVITTMAEALRRIASGAYSPVEAYLDGVMQVIGDVGLGKRMIRHLAGEGTQDTGCLLLLDPVWIPDGTGFGSLTVSGRFFTPGANVDIHYDFGGGQFRKFVVPNENTEFRVTEVGIPCGGSVTVTAFDVASAQNVTDNFATPC